MGLVDVEDKANAVEEFSLVAAGQQMLTEARSDLYWENVGVTNEKDLKRRREQGGGRSIRSEISLDHAIAWKNKAELRLATVTEAIGFRYTEELEDHPGLGDTFKIVGSRDGKRETLTASFETTSDGSRIVYSGSHGETEYSEKTARERAKRLEPVVRRMYALARSGSVKAPRATGAK